MSVRPTFDSRQKFVVMRSIKFAGRTFVSGAEFPWRSIGCSVRRLRQMYDGRKLNMLHAQDALSENELKAMEPTLQPMDAQVVKVEPLVIEAPITSTIDDKTEVVDTSKEDKKPELTEEEKKAKKAARRKAARKAAKLAAAKGE